MPDAVAAGAGHPQPSRVPSSPEPGGLVLAAERRLITLDLFGGTAAAGIPLAGVHEPGTAGG